MSQHGCPERLSNRSKGFQEDAPSQPTMEVLVETLTGTAFEMTVSPSDTILAIKSKIFRVEGIPVSQQHILYNLKELDDASSLREHAISDGARLRLVLGMRVGPISTRRLPPPANAEPWRDIERLLDGNRDEGEWCSSSGCRVTVVVLRDGGRINLLRVRQNRDGTYSPLETGNKYSSSLTLVEQELDEDVADSVHDNEVTMGKMIDLRRRMENLSVQKRRDNKNGDKAEIQKTRSEETLSVPSLLDEATVEPFQSRPYPPYEEDSFAPLYDGNYTRYDYDCSFADRYTLLPPLEWSVTPNLPPIGTRTDSEPSVQETETDRLKLSDALAGSILVQGRREREEESAILEECLDAEQCHLREGSPQLAAKNLAAIPAAEYGPLVCGSGPGGAWRGTWGSAQLSPPAREPRHAAPISHSASSLHSLHALHSLHSLHTLAAPLRPPHTPRHPPLQDAVFSSSTSDLEKLKRNSRILPALSRHRNREHLHLSDDGLDLRARPRNLEVGCERRQRQHLNHSHTDLNHRHGDFGSMNNSRSDLNNQHGHTLSNLTDQYIHNDFKTSFKSQVDFSGDLRSFNSDLNTIEVRRNDMDRSAEDRLFRFDDYHGREELPKVQPAATKETSPVPAPAPAPPPPPPPPVRPPRARCSFCRKRLSIATEHRCRCGALFCAPHRYAEVHGCAYDYRAHAHQLLAKENPRVAATKLPKI